MRYPIYTPDISRYTASLQKAIADGWISSQGEFLEKARAVASHQLGSPYVVLVNNGTSATHLLYKALKFKHPMLRKIYVPDYVFAAVWNCALYEYPADVISVLPTNPATLNPVFEGVEPNSAVVIVHNVGNIVNVPQLQRERPDLIFVEDCCEAFLEEYEGRKTGTAGLCAAVSFFGNKIVTTGEGGLWYTHDKDLYDFIYKSCHHGMTSERYVYDVLGYNYRMTNLQAALLYDQMRDIDAILDTKRNVRDRYAAMLSPWMVSSGLWMNVLRVPNGRYADIAPKLRGLGIDTRPMFYSIHTHAHLREIAATSTPINHDEVFMIPSSPTLSLFDQVFISHALRAVVLGREVPTVVRIATENRSLLDAFVAQPQPATFRYFAKRTVDECLENHTLTLVATQDERPIGYAHLDDRWVGLCVLPEWQGRGYGTFILDIVLDYARQAGISPLRLTVDKTNEHACQMYTRRGFVVQEVTDTFYRMTNDDQASSIDRGGSR
jgi:perosamine synthetase